MQDVAPLREVSHFSERRTSRTSSADFENLSYVDLTLSEGIARLKSTDGRVESLGNLVEVVAFFDSIADDARFFISAMRDAKLGELNLLRIKVLDVFFRNPNVIMFVVWGRDFGS